MSKKDEKVVKASETAKLAEETKTPTLEERITKLENIVKSAFGVSL